MGKKIDATNKSVDDLSVRNDSLNSALRVLVARIGALEYENANHLAALKMLRSSVDELNQNSLRSKDLLDAVKVLNAQNDSLKAELSGFQVRFADFQKEINMSQKDRLELRTKEGKEYAKLKEQIEDLGLRLGFVNRSLSLVWSKNEAVPDYKLDSLSRMGEVDLPRWLDWRSRNDSKMFNYGALQYEQTGIGEYDDYSVLIGSGWSGRASSGFDGWFFETGFGLGLQRASCGLRGSEYVCEEDSFGESKHVENLAFLTQLKAGWNFIPARYFSQFKGVDIGLHFDLGWRGNWTVQVFEDGEPHFNSKFNKAYYGDWAAGFLGNAILWDIGLGYYF